MIKPESAFINSVHKKLKQAKPEILIRKISDRFNQGWPDVLYIGPFGYDLWIEYKVHPNKLSKMQEHIIQQLTSYDKQIAVITKWNDPHFNKPRYHIVDYQAFPHDSIEVLDPATWIMTELGFICEPSTL